MPLPCKPPTREEMIAGCESDAAGWRESAAQLESPANDCCGTVAEVLRVRAQRCEDVAAMLKADLTTIESLSRPRDPAAVLAARRLVYRYGSRAVLDSLRTDILVVARAYLGSST